MQTMQAHVTQQTRQDVCDTPVVSLHAYKQFIHEQSAAKIHRLLGKWQEPYYKHRPMLTRKKHTHDIQMWFIRMIDTTHEPPTFTLYLGKYHKHYTHTDTINTSATARDTQTPVYMVYQEIPEQDVTRVLTYIVNHLVKPELLA